MDGPAKSAAPGRPGLILVVGGATGHLLSSAHIVEQDLVARAVRHESGAVHREVKVSYSAMMALDALHWLVVLSDVIGDNLAIMSADSADTAIT